MATYGLRTRDAVTGEIRLEITDRITNFIGDISTGRYNGHIAHPDFGVKGTPFWVVRDWGNIAYDYQPNITVEYVGSELAIVWRWPEFLGEGNPGNVPCTISYGTF